MSNLFARSGQLAHDTEITSLWPQGGLIWNSSQWEGPCPFCDPNSTDGQPILEGDNRFFITPGYPGGTCRKCNAAGRGPTGKGWYSDYQIAVRFGKTLPADYKPATPGEKLDTPLYYHGEQFVKDTYAAVDYSWWANEYHWDAALVDHFRLGKGIINPKIGEQHLIPMKVERYGRPPLDDAWYYAGRSYGVDGKKLKIRSSGSSKHFMALIEEDPPDKTLVITEGDTDPLTAWFLGWRNIASVFGSNTWTDDKAQLIVDRGYTKIVILTDADNGGQTLAEHIIHSFRKRNVNDLWILVWGDTTGDISQLLKTKNRTEARSWILGRLVETTEAAKQSNQHPQYNTEDRIKQPLISLSELRGTGDNALSTVIRKFVQNYNLLNIANGEILHLGVPPGGGKTHALIQQAEATARESLKTHDNQRQWLEEQIEEKKKALQLDPNSGIEGEIEELVKKLARISKTAVAWFGQYKHGWDDVMQTGANPELWYNYEARSADNCQNFKTVTELGQKHHDIGYFCRTSCPFFKECQQQGYMKQEEERKEKPITFFRHQHLYASMEQDYRELVVVDEFAGHVLENNPIRFIPDHIQAHRTGWQLNAVSFEMVEAVNYFAEATRAAMSSNSGALQTHPDGSANQDYILSGTAFLRKLDHHCQSIAGKSLQDLVTDIDSVLLHQQYQPNYAGNKDEPILLRCLPQFFDVVLRELPDYIDNPNHQYPSCIHCVAGSLEIYAPERIKTRHRTPMIIADATGIPVLYNAMFKRKVTQYAPIIRNPNAQIEVITGSDWTKGAMRQQMPHLKQRKELEDKPPTVISLEGETFDSSTIEPSATYAPMVQHALGIVKVLAERHASLLVVTHKDLREVVESLGQGMLTANPDEHSYLNNVTWAHYGAVRGTNKYQDYEAVALLGCFRIPYNIIWRRIQMWAWMLGIKEYLPPETTKVMSVYDTPTFAQTEHRSFMHQFEQAYVDMIEKGELQQSAARIRPHSTENKKFVYCFANRPAMQFVNKLTPQNEWLRQTEVHGHYEIYTYMKKHYEKEKKFPSYRLMKTEYKVGTDTVKKLRLQIEKECQDASLQSPSPALSLPDRLS